MSSHTEKENPVQSMLKPTNVSQIGAVNWLGVYTLLSKEVRRFLKVPLQTVFAPMMTTMLFLAIFTLAFGNGERYVGDLPYANFLGPGLIMMAVIQNSFANTSSSLLISKVQGNIVDILMPPLSASELTFAFALSGLARGLTVAIVVGLTMWLLIDLTVYSWPAVLYFVIGAGLMLSLLGMIGGIVSDKFDHMAAMTNFVIMPLSFLSGTFYSIDRLTGVWYQISHINPFFYMIDGFRYGFIGTSDSSVWIGVVVIAVLDGLLYLTVWTMFKRGYKLKA
jgi:ABC-2 type transport system permease protein